MSSRIPSGCGIQNVENVKFGIWTFVENLDFELLSLPNCSSRLPVGSRRLEIRLFIVFSWDGVRATSLCGAGLSGACSWVRVRIRIKVKVNVCLRVRNGGQGLGVKG
jgi:hypothetical protein